MLLGISDAGPSDWTQWASDLRNVYVHRPRRMTISQANPRPIGVLSPSGAPYLNTEFVEILPRDPARSDIDVFVSVGKPELIMLSERAEVTVNGVRGSMVRAIHAAATRLRSAWKERVSNPSLVTQPREQWMAADSESRCSFDGYAPSSYPVIVNAFQMPAALQNRFVAAAVLDHDKHYWQSAPPL